MKVLMFGWEFPPYVSGGLGNACYLLTKGLHKKGVNITFVIPYSGDEKAEYVNLIAMENVKDFKLRLINSIIEPYITSEEYKSKLSKYDKSLYGNNLYHEVYRFSLAALDIASKEDFDIIHCHDWMTYQAGINIKHMTNKPLIVHIHNTVFDRSSLKPTKYEYDIEKAGFENADKIIAISNRIKNLLVDEYNIDKNKISVAHWGLDHENPDYYQKPPIKSLDNKVVLFVGRITMQKGVDYLIEAAKKVLDFEPNVRFIIVGFGDMLPQSINRAIELGINNKINFTGWFSPKDVFKAFKIADLFVMPSVSEPFGLVALESLKNGTPALISKQSGVSEVINNCLKVDFWDIKDMTDKIVNSLRYDSLNNELRYNGMHEVEKLNIDKPADETLKAYKEVLIDG